MSNNSANPAERSTRFIPVSKFDQFHPWPTPQGIRSRIVAAERGKDPDFLLCVRRVGGRLLIDESAFFDWLNANQNSGA